MNPQPLQQTQQLLAIYIPLLSPIVMFVIVRLGIFFNNRHIDARIADVNARIDDFNRSMNSRLDDLAAALRAEMRAESTELRVLIEKNRSESAELRPLIEKNHSEMLVKFAELDQRLSRLECERRVIT